MTLSPYFAYGYNMCADTFKERCPGAVLVGRAQLENHEFFIFDEGYASVRSNPGSTVAGVLWHISRRDEAALDTFEEVDRGLYHKLHVPVITATGSVSALVYVAASAQPGRSEPGYIETVIRGAKERGLEASYISQLETWLPQSVDRN